MFDGTIHTTIRDLTQDKLDIIAHRANSTLTPAQVLQLLDDVSEEEVARRLMEAISRILHETRTDLNTIMGLSEILGSERFGGVVNARHKQYANDIHETGNELMTFIDQELPLLFRGGYKSRSLH